jgi:hypothetical protein
MILWFILAVSPPSNRTLQEGGLMKHGASLIALFFLLAAAPAAWGQEKGVDAQSQRIRDTGNSRTPAVNGGKQDVGTSGSGINFGKDKTRTATLIPNPYRLTARRDALVRAVGELMRNRKLILDEAASKPGEGIIVSQPYTFIKGAVVTQSELSRFANVENADARGWTKGRYTITVEIQPIDGTSSNVSVNAKIEGRTDGASGAEWITLVSTGTAEQEFLSALVESVTGSTPGGRP